MIKYSTDVSMSLPQQQSIKFERCDQEEYASLQRLLTEPGVIMQDPAWVRFISASQDAEPVYLRISADGVFCGTFTGAIVRKFGIKILGSPMEGWTTPFMGFRLAFPVDRNRLVDALRPFAFSKLGVDYIEIVDNQMVYSPSDKKSHQLFNFTYLVDLTRSESELFASFTSACRRCIRKARKSSVIIEQVEPDDPDFAEEYYSMLVDVFAKQSLKPTYPKERVKTLLSSLAGTDALLLIRARHPETRETIAAGIFPAGGTTMHFWGGSSWRSHQHLRPNELVMWTAMLHWKSRGMTTFDLGGGSEYKLKYQPVEARYTRLCLARWEFLLTLRAAAKWVFRKRAVLIGRMRSSGSSPSNGGTLNDPSGEEEP